MSNLYHKYKKYKQKYLALKGGKNKIESLDIVDWIELAREKGLLLKWDDLKKLKRGDKLELAVDLIGQSGDNTEPTNPEEYFKKEIYVFPNILDGHDYGSIIENEKNIYNPFYEADGLAVIGSGGGESMEWKNLKKMPFIRDSE